MTNQVTQGLSHDIRWSYAALNDLSGLDVFKLARLRQSVFIVEQCCSYHDLDNEDLRAIHMLGQDENETLAACARIIIQPATIRIGRVVVAPDYRGSAVGHILMANAIEYIRANVCESRPIRLSAQSHLVNFYRSHSFDPVGDTYFEDGISHQEMICNTINGDT